VRRIALSAALNRSRTRGLRDVVDEGTFGASAAAIARGRALRAWPSARSLRRPSGLRSTFGLAPRAHSRPPHPFMLCD
jgi:hypothetical protein